MNRLAVAIATAGSVFVTSTVLAGDPGLHSFAAKRQFASQVIACMRKRMAADRYISYNHAAKACKDEVIRQIDGSNAGPLVAADTKR